MISTACAGVFLYFDNSALHDVQRCSCTGAVRAHGPAPRTSCETIAMIKELLLIHPLGQAAACLFGVFNLVTGLTRRCFFLPLHINFGVLFYALMLVGAGVGVLSARMAAAGGMALSFDMHALSAYACMATLLCGAVSGFVLLKKDRPRSIAALHRCSNIAALLLVCLQAVTGLRALAGVL